MSVSKAWTADQDNRQSAVAAYRRADCPGLESIATELGTTFHNVQWVVRNCLSEAERKALARIRYSRSKQGTRNPMHGKTGDRHHNWKGLCEDGHGYLTCLWRGRREFVHRIVMMKALGLTKLPRSMAVHHIDGDPKNNLLDNLAVLTHLGHRAVHYMQVKDSLSLVLKRSSLKDALRYVISQ